MASEAQIEANQRNALKSTGPRTPEGKRHASRNALKHGLTAQQVLLPGEDPEEFEQFLEGMVATFTPENQLEHELVGRAASLMWRLRRIPSFEAAVLQLRQQSRRVVRGGGYSWEPLPENERRPFDLGKGLDFMLEADRLGKISRYEVTLQKQLKEILAELRQLIEARPKPLEVAPSTVSQLPPPSVPETPAAPEAENAASNDNAGDARPFPDRLMEG